MTLYASRTCYTKSYCLKLFRRRKNIKQHVKKILYTITLLYDTLTQMRAESKDNADASRRHIPISRAHFKKLFPASNPTSGRSDLSNDALFVHPLCNNSLYSTCSSLSGLSSWGWSGYVDPKSQFHCCSQQTGPFKRIYYEERIKAYYDAM